MLMSRIRRGSQGFYIVEAIGDTWDFGSKRLWRTRVLLFSLPLNTIQYIDRIWRYVREQAIDKLVGLWSWLGDTWIYRGPIRKLHSRSGNRTSVHFTQDFLRRQLTLRSNPQNTPTTIPVTIKTRFFFFFQISTCRYA